MKTIKSSMGAFKANKERQDKERKMKKQEKNRFFDHMKTSKPIQIMIRICDAAGVSEEEVRDSIRGSLARYQEFHTNEALDKVINEIRNGDYDHLQYEEKK